MDLRNRLIGLLLLAAALAYAPVLNHEFVLLKSADVTAPLSGWSR